MSGRTEYSLKIRINGRNLNKVVIDQHYKKKHKEVNDQIILDLVRQLDDRDFEIEELDGNFQYFCAEPVLNNGAPFRLVLLLCTTDDYLGVVNAFRIKR